jgi:hypothetical protein
MLIFANIAGDCTADLPSPPRVRPNPGLGHTAIPESLSREERR